MRVIGLLGGMSWESSAIYYRLLNQGVRAARGGQASARILMYSVDFAEIVSAQQAGDWEGAAGVLADGARRLERGGAELALLCTNTMHLVFDHVQAAVSIPFMHVVDETAKRIGDDGRGTVGLLGTRFTMAQAFYRERLTERCGAEVIVPDAADQELVDRVIFDELCRGEVRDESRREYLRVIASLAERGAQGVVLGCTEIGLLVRQEDTPVPVYDTTEIHAAAALERALAV